jgi:hypothetical protein
MYTAKRKDHLFIFIFFNCTIWTKKERLYLVRVLGCHCVGRPHRPIHGAVIEPSLFGQCVCCVEIFISFFSPPKWFSMGPEHVKKNVVESYWTGRYLAEKCSRCVEDAATRFNFVWSSSSSSRLYFFLLFVVFLRRRRKEIENGGLE